LIPDGIMWVPHRSATYRNLDPGRYIFKVRASNQDGIWSQKITSLEIFVLPLSGKHGGLTPFFIFAWLIGLIIISLLSKRKCFKKQITFRTNKQEKRGRFNQEKLRFFTNISHESGPRLLLYLVHWRTL